MHLVSYSLEKYRPPSTGRQAMPRPVLLFDYGETLLVFETRGLVGNRLKGKFFCWDLDANNQGFVVQRQTCYLQHYPNIMC